MIGRSVLKSVIQKSTHAQRLYRLYKRRFQNQYYPQWQKIIDAEPTTWKEAKTQAKNGPQILLATSAGGHPSSAIMDSFLAAALTLRGGHVSFLLCDSFLPACQMVEIALMRPATMIRTGPQSYFCRGCYERAGTIYDPLELPILKYSEHVSAEELRETEHLVSTTPLDDIESYVIDGVAVGEHAMAGALRYFARSTLEDLPHAEEVLKSYFKAALLTVYAVTHIIRTYRIDTVCVNHGIYVPHGLVAEVARSINCRLVAWNVAYRKRSFIFSHGETYHHTLMTEPVSEWEGMHWSEKKEIEILDYLRSRRRGGRDWIVFQAKNAQDDLTEIAKDIPGIDFSRPCIGMLANVAWDAQLHYPANAFPNMIDWVIKTIDYFRTRTDLQLIIRVHPAEISGDIKSNQPILNEIYHTFPNLPSNIFVIPPDQAISTYAITEACNAVIIYGTKTGVELTSLGIPVIVAGEAWIRNKGVTTDAESEEHYYQILDQLPHSSRMSEKTTTRARKYAYHFFFRRMIPVSQMESTGREPQFRINCKTLSDLMPGRSKGLDVICEGILTGSPFVYPSETY